MKKLLLLIIFNSLFVAVVFGGIYILNEPVLGFLFPLLALIDWYLIEEMVEVK